MLKKLIDKQEMITKTALKERGWTDSLIKTFLKEPDLVKANPKYRQAAPMSLYLLKKVKKIESRDLFKNKLVKVKVRQEAAKKAVATKTEKLHSYLDTIEVSVPKLSEKELIEEACDHYNSFRDRGDPDYNYASKNSDIGFLNRICVNYLRHCLTDYEELLHSISGRVGFDEGYIEIKTKILKEIKSRYPKLSGECNRQAGFSI